MTPPLYERIKHLIYSALISCNKLFPDKLYISLLYFLTFGKRLSWKHPSTFNEKLNWLKIHDRNPIYVTLCDKRKVKKYVAEKIGAKYVIPTLKELSKIEDLDMDRLPEKFVIKTNHDSGTVFICTDKSKFNINVVRRKIRDSLNRDFSLPFREWPYKYVERKIIIEKFLESTSVYGLNDYKFFCFNGKAKFLKVDFDRSTNHCANYYSLSWQLLPFGERVCPPNPNHEIAKPKNFEKMLELAEQLSSDIPFARVDFYNLDGEIYFGELTFYPAAGLGHFIPETADLELGHLLQL